MRKDKILSIILPIYNVEKYLKECITSIVKQIDDEDDVEIILVDDGSNDGCPQICDEYTKKYPYIKTFHKKNGGLSDARNYGLNVAEGKYIYFLDSDDYISENFLSTIKKELKNEIDIILFDGICVDENSNFMETKYDYKHYGLENKKIYNSKELILNQLNTGKEMPTVVWLGIYRKEYIIENNLMFERGLIHEDELWTPKAFLNAKSIIYINQSLYFYRIRNNSIMRSKDNTKHIESLVYIYESLPIYFEYKIYDKNLLTILKDEFAKRYLHAIYSWQFNKYKKLFKRVNRRRILKNSIKAKNRIRGMLLCASKNFYCFLGKIKGE